MQINNEYLARDALTKYIPFRNPKMRENMLEVWFSLSIPGEQNVKPNCNKP